MYKHIWSSGDGVVTLSRTDCSFLMEFFGPEDPNSSYSFTINFSFADSEMKDLADIINKILEEETNEYGL